MSFEKIKAHVKRNKWLYLLVLFCVIIFGILAYRNKEFAFGLFIGIVLIHSIKFYFALKKS